MMNWKFCPHCGAALVPKMEGGRERPVCTRCAYVAYGRFSVGVGGLLVHDKRVLLVQRNHDPGKGRWTLPGGYVEEDEPPETALEREVREETGLRVRSTGILTVRHTSAKDGQNVYIVFGMELAGSLDQLRPDGDGVETAHVGLYRLAEFDALGEMGLISRWVAERYQPGDAALLRAAPELEQRLRYSGAWVALFAACPNAGAE